MVKDRAPSAPCRSFQPKCRFAAIPAKEIAASRNPRQRAWSLEHYAPWGGAEVHRYLAQSCEARKIAARQETVLDSLCAHIHRSHHILRLWKWRSANANFADPNFARC